MTPSSRGSLDKLYDIDCCFVNMFRLDDRTDEGSQGIEERLRRGGLIRDEGRRTDRPPDPRATMQTSLTRINYFVERNGHDAAEGGNSPPHLTASFTPLNARGKSSTIHWI